MSVNNNRYSLGSASWTLDMASNYPNSTFYGIDIAPTFPTANVPENCRFQIASLTDKLPFPDNHFDYIHQRLLVSAISKQAWDNVSPCS